MSAHEYLDPKQPEVAPLIYFGFDENIPLQDDDVCERWGGLAQEQIYHIHKRDNERWEHYAGGDVIGRKKDPGRVYFYLTSTTDYWFITVVKSIISRFPDASRRCLTFIDGLPSGQHFRNAEDPPLSDQEAREMEWIRQRPLGAQRMRISMRIDFPDRLQAKLALGFARTILGPRAVFSPYGDNLRDLLWSQRPDQREGFELRGSSWWTQEDDDIISRFLMWKGAWVICLKAFGDAYGLIVATPMGRMFSMMISDDPSTWNNDIENVFLEGAIYVFVPQRRRCVGPIPIMSYVSYKLGRSDNHDLENLKSLRVDVKDLPPK